MFERRPEVLRATCDATRKAVQVSTNEDGVGECGFADDVVPFVDGQLAGDQDGGVLVPVLDDFHEVASLIGAEAAGSLIVEDEEIGLGESAEQAGVETRPQRPPIRFTLRVPHAIHPLSSLNL